MLTRTTYWTSGFTQSELDQAQERYDIRFPPDLAGFLLDRSPGGGYDWSTDDHRIYRMLAWPTELPCLTSKTGFGGRVGVNVLSKNVFEPKWFATL